jgi:polynucleotide 5'-kinase involved in rRNA processing
VPEWADAIAAAESCRRILVLGDRDVGKSSLVRALCSGRRRNVIDLDPGQTMIGPPGAVSRGRLGPDRLSRYAFIGSTSPVHINAVTQAAAELAGRAEPFVANTAGFVTGIGARLQAATIARLRPDCLLLVGEAPELEPALGRAQVCIIRLPTSPFARPKTAAMRRQVRQLAFERALADARRVSCSRLRFLPAPPPLLASDERPVCSVADERGRDVGYGLVLGPDELFVSKLPPEPTPVVRLGRIWARPGADGWSLLERLAPAWTT